MYICAFHIKIWLTNKDVGNNNADDLYKLVSVLLLDENMNVDISSGCIIVQITCKFVCFTSRHD